MRKNVSSTSYQLGFVVDAEVMLKEQFYVMENRVVIYSHDYYHIINDFEVARQYKIEHESIWHNQKCLHEPKKVVLYLKQLIDKIKEN